VPVPAPIDPDRHKTGTDRPELFYDVFDTYFVLNGPKRYDILKILIKYKMSINYVIKQPGPVGTSLVPVQSGQGRSGPVGTGAADRPQETLYKTIENAQKRLGTVNDQER
jgi:hypothetical protein